MIASFDSGKRGPLDPSLLDAVLDAAGLASRRRRIRCPHCAWQPSRLDRWSCFCGTEWNTFDTAGKCPGCGFQWQWTQCLRCKRRAEHARWYE
jgi:hypothetical protein